MLPIKEVVLTATSSAAALSNTPLHLDSWGVQAFELRLAPVDLTPEAITTAMLHISGAEVDSVRGASPATLHINGTAYETTGYMADGFLLVARHTSNPETSLPLQFFLVPAYANTATEWLQKLNNQLPFFLVSREDYRSINDDARKKRGLYVTILVLLQGLLPE